MNPGPFVVFEGIEGSGKSTQARLLSDWLTSRHVPHVLTREPGGTAVGEEIRQTLLHSHDMPAETELLLMNAARAALLAEVIRPALQAGKVVLADRFYHSSLAYQGYGRGVPIEKVRQICQFATGGLIPDVTLLLTVPLATGSARRATRGGPDRIENAGTEFHARVAEAYRLLPGTESEVEIIEGEGSVDVVQQRIRELLARRFPETFAQTGVR